MHSQLITGFCCRVSVIIFCLAPVAVCDAPVSAVGLLCIGQQSNRWPPRRRQIMQAASSTSHSQHAPSCPPLRRAVPQLPYDSFPSSALPHAPPSPPSHLWLDWPCARRNFRHFVQFDQRGPISTLRVPNWMATPSNSSYKSLWLIRSIRRVF